MNDINKEDNNNKQNNDLIECIQIKYEETITGFFQKLIIKFENCCEKKIIGLKILFIIIGGINFILSIVALSTLIKKNKYYIAFSAEVILEQANYYSLYTSGITVISSSSSFSMDDYNLPTFTQFWCNIGKAEDGVLISYLVFLILYLIFEIFSLLLHKNVIKLEIKGALYNIIVLINIIFLIIFYIYIPLFIYLFIYSILVSTISPLNVNYHSEITRTKSLIEEEWDNNKTLPIVNSVIIFVMYIFIHFQTSIKASIILYLSMKFEGDDLNNAKIKTKKLDINNKTLGIEVKANQILYIKESGSNTFYKFKEMKIEGETNNFIHVRLENEAIIDILSFTDWDYSYFNDIFLKLAKISKFIYGILIVSIASFKMHINNEINYILMKEIYFDIDENEPKFYDVFIMYGSLEKSFSESRFALYIISLFFILLFMLKRVYFGGFSKYAFSLISFIFSSFFILLNIILALLTFIMIIVTIFSLVSYFDGFKDLKEDMIIMKLFIQIALNICILGIIIPLLMNTIRLTISLNRIRNEVSNLNNNKASEELEIKKGFKYKGLDFQEHILNELQIEGHPRYLYYTLDNNKNISPESIQLININNNKDKTIEDNQNTISPVQNNSVFINLNKSRRNSKIQKSLKKRNSKINKTNEVDIEEKIKNENLTLRSENKNLRNELERLKNQLNSVINSIKN